MRIDNRIKPLSKGKQDLTMELALQKSMWLNSHGNRLDIVQNGFRK